ncbi:Anaphase-promoting complex subunit cut9 [Teratosphaeria destructans]|uniref:Anaphase-promoting complex subunit cut9 n=1 Tax=Teratosphaeria destructans TaxID=418781 RepID=A0A9W7SWP5_9PEZI|nr:Anaphase-promoting complex subunit cut9 [Teratosphaeria destructans]
MEAYLRRWRQDSLDRHQYDAAIFVGDKLLALTNSDGDAYALAQSHFAAGHYTRALSFVTRADLLHRSSAARYLAAHCYVRQNRHEDALQLLGHKNPTHLVTTADSARRKLQHTAAHGGPDHGKTTAPSRDRADRSEERDFTGHEDRRFEAGMCHLRGLCYAKQNAFDRAKDCFRDAVRIDIQCFEALDELMRNKLMSPGEEWDFLDSLNFDSIEASQPARDGAAEAADFTRSLYVTRLSKYARLDDFNAAIDTLSSHYKLASNPDILLSRAEILATSSRFEPALQLSSSILDSDPYNFAALPLHLSLLYQLHHTNALFALSHDLADTHPDEPCTWLAVGTYYLATNRIPEARSYFSKASLMDPHFGPAWIGFAHTFAAEGEGDQAIAAYSTAARLFPGTHLPQLFLGMQELALDNLAIAREYLTSAYGLCERDPLLINELGVCAFKEERFDAAVEHFELALAIAEANGAPASQSKETRLNLAHALRRLERYADALEHFDEVIRLGHRDCGVFASKGLVLLEMERPFEAVVALHEGLAISPQDPVASELLGRGLALLEGVGVLGGEDGGAIDEGLEGRLRVVRARRGKRRGVRGGERMEVGE